MLSIIDMETLLPHRPRRPLVWFSRLLGLLSGLLLVVTPLAVVLGAVVASGKGTLRIDARLDPPYSIGLDGPPADVAEGFGRRIDVGGDGIAAYVNLPIGEERAVFDDAPRVHASIVVPRDDRDTRVLALAVGLGWLTLAWVGLENLRRVVAAALAGEPFHARNVGRLRWVAGTVLLFAALSQMFVRLIERSLDTTEAVTPIFTGTPWWILVVVGMGLLALAEVFRVGSDLHELERSTV